jgi:flagellar biogenesis protein FliO
MGSIDFFSSLIKMISALAVVVGIMIAAMYCIKKYMKGAGTGIDDGRFIKILSTRYIGPKCSIMLVDILDNVIAVGLANNQITMLTTISDQKSLERLNDFEREKKNPISLFNNLALYRSKLSALDKKRKVSREHE